MITLQETPLERHVIDGVEVFVKREDLCWPYPPISKARGVWRAIEQRPEASTLAVVDTGKSVNGLLVTTIGLTMERRIYVGYPRYVKNPDVIPGPAMAVKSLAPSGVELIPLQASRQFMMLSEMKRFMDERCPTFSFTFPTGLRLPETVEATEEQALAVLDTLGEVGTFVVPTGTGTHLAGVLRATASFSGDVVAVQGYGRPEHRFRQDVWKMAQLSSRSPLGCMMENDRLRVVTSLCDYYEARPEKLPAWPANAYYEVKAYAWLRTPGVIESLKQPIVFWNIGQ